MASKRNVYVERGKDGLYRAKHAHNDSPTGIATDTQRQAIEAVKRQYPGVRPDVERQRNTKAGGRDRWRKA
jgi:hypothetical protein